MQRLLNRMNLELYMESLVQSELIHWLRDTAFDSGLYHTLFRNWSRYHTHTLRCKFEWFLPKLSYICVSHLLNQLIIYHKLYIKKIDLFTLRHILHVHFSIFSAANQHLLEKYDFCKFHLSNESCIYKMCNMIYCLHLFCISLSKLISIFLHI